MEYLLSAGDDKRLQYATGAKFSPSSDGKPQNWQRR
jgi:hypothetical protein